MATQLDTTPAPVRFLIDRFGGRFTEEDGTVYVVQVPTKIVGNNPECVALTMINVGGFDVYVRPANNPSSTGGILLLATGGSVSLTVRDDAMLPGREWYGVGGSGDSNVYFIRVLRYHVEA